MFIILAIESHDHEEGEIAEEAIDGHRAAESQPTRSPPTDDAVRRQPTIGPNEPGSHGPGT